MKLKKYSNRNKLPYRWLCVIIPALLLWGCQAPYYRNQADKAVYDIIQQVEIGLFGRTNEFSIDTAYSPRDPETILPAELINQRRNTNAMVLNLDDCIQMGITHSRRYQSEREQVYLTALELTGSRHAFSPQFFANSTITGTRFYDPSSGKSEKLIRVNSRVGVSKAFQNGANIGVSIANDLLKYYTGDPRKSAVSAITVDLFQPLLRGFGTDIAGEQLKQAERNVVYSIRDYSHFQDEFAVDIVNEYFSVLRAKDTVKNQYQNYLSRSNTTSYLKARSVDRVAPLDADQAEQEELAAKNTYISSIANYFSALDRFKITLGLPVSMEIRLDDQDFLDLENVGTLPVYVTKEDGFELALNHYLPVLNEIDRFEDSKRKIKVAANGLKADLNIFADAGVDSEEPTKYTKFNFDEVRANVGIELNLPLDRLRERNIYRTTVINFESRVRTLEEFLDNMKNRIDQGLRDLEESRLSYVIAQRSVELAQRRVDGAQLSFQAGQTVLRNVLDAQDDLIQAKNRATFDLVNYVQTRLALLLDMGILNTEINEFWLGENVTDVDLSTPIVRPGTGFEGDAVLPPELVFEKKTNQNNQ